MEYTMNYDDSSLYIISSMDRDDDSSFYIISSWYMISSKSLDSIFYDRMCPTLCPTMCPNGSHGAHALLCPTLHKWWYWYWCCWHRCYMMWIFFLFSSVQMFTNCSEYFCIKSGIQSNPINMVIVSTLCC